METDISPSPLLDYIPDDILNEAILNFKDVDNLKTALTLKLARIKSDSFKLNFPIKTLLSDENLKRPDILNILLMCFQVRQENGDYFEYLHQILADIQEDKLDLSFKLIHLWNSLVKKTKTVFERNVHNEVVIKFLKVALSKASPKNLHAIEYFLINLGVDKIIQDAIWDIVKLENNIEILCFLFNYLNLNEWLLSSDEYWEFLCSNINLKNNYKQMLLMHIMRESLDILFMQNKVFETPKGIIAFDEENILDLRGAWESFFVLMEVSQEKQLHLVLPSLPLLETIEILHPSFIASIYDILLRHSQMQIVCFSLKSLLSQRWYWNNEFFSSVTQNVLSTLNKFNSYEEAEDIFLKLHNFTKSLDKQHRKQLFIASLGINFTPSVCWYFYKNCLNNNSGNLEIYPKLLMKIQALTHRYIRVGCVMFILRNINEHVNNLGINQLFDVMSSIKDLSSKTTLNQLKNLNITAFMDEIMNFDYFNCTEDRITLFFEFLNHYSVEIDACRLLDICYSNNPALDPYKRDLIYNYLFDYFVQNEIENLILYIHNRFTIITEDDDISVLITIVHKVRDVNFGRKTELVYHLGTKFVNVLKNPNQFNSNQLKLSIVVCESFSMIPDEIYATWISLFKNVSQKYDPYICKYVIKALLNKHSESDACVIVRNILDMQINEVTDELIKHFPAILKNYKTMDVITCIDYCFDLIASLKRSQDSKALLVCYIGTILKMFRLDYLDKELENVKGALIQIVVKIFNLAKSYDFCASTILKCLKYQFPDFGYEVQISILPHVVDLFLSYNTIFRKCDNLDYEACKDVYQQNFPMDSNNFEYPLNLEQDVKVQIFEMLESCKNCENSSLVYQEFTERILEKYKDHFKQRYFPHSQIHLQKLRTMQVLLLLHEDLTLTTKKTLLGILLESLEIENHQICVKQLMQILVAELCKATDSKELLFEKLINTNNVSFQLALIPVIYQIIDDSPVSFIEKVAKHLVKLSMGPLFAVRLYSQVAFTKIYERVAETFPKFRSAFQAVHESMKQILIENAEQIESTLNKHALLFDYFDSENDLNVEFVLVKIPKLNKVIAQEWEIYEHYILQKNKLSPKARINDLIEKYCRIDKTENPSSVQFSGDMQKKILPWKEVLEDEENDDKILSELIVVTSLINSAANIGGLTRTCEIFKVKKLVIPNRKIVSESDYKNLSMNSENWVDVHEVKECDLRDYIDSMKTQSYTVIGLEQTLNSVNLNNYNMPKKLMIILGNEKQGIPPNLIPHLDECIEIPQLGLTRSLNVHVAGAIIIWEYTKMHLL